MATRASANPAPPLADLNVTPLIDVMLVLLVMIIMTIPIAINAIEVELPLGPGTPRVEEVSNSVSISPDNHIYWNGADVTHDQLRAALVNSLQLPIEPELQFRPDAAASYGLTAEVIHTIKASGVTKFGFVGNEQYAAFGKATG